MKKIKSVPLPWKTIKPASFPCMICKENEAVFMDDFAHEGVTFHLCLCDICHHLEGWEIYEKIKKEVLS